MRLKYSAVNCDGSILQSPPTLRKQCITLYHIRTQEFIIAAGSREICAIFAVLISKDR